MSLKFYIRIKIRILGVIFDEHLSFIEHFKEVKRYFSSRIVAVYQLKQLGLSDYCLKQTTLALRNKITFGLYQFTKISISSLNNIEILWRRILRAWTGANRYVPNSILYQVTGVCSIEDFSEYLLICRLCDTKRRQLVPFEIYPDPIIDLNGENSEINNLEIRLKLKYNFRSSTINNSADCDRREKLKKKGSILNYYLSLSYENNTNTYLQLFYRAKLFSSRIKTCNQRHRQNHHNKHKNLEAEDRLKYIRLDFIRNKQIRFLISKVKLG